MGKAYSVIYDHILLNNQIEQSIDLDGNVIGVQLRVYNTSPSGLLYGLGIGPTIPLSATDLPASYGGYHVNNVPAIIGGPGKNMNIRWNNNTQGQGVLVIARLVLEPVDGVELCE